MTNGITLHGALWMTVGNQRFAENKRMALLAKVAECGSITQAAKAIGMSYKAAWDAIDSMNNLAGEAMVERSVGGKGGGGTRLTPRGERLLQNYCLIDREHNRFIAQLEKQADGIMADYLLMGRMTMKTSARNQFLGKVTRIQPGAVNLEVEMEIGGGHRIVAVVTRESADDLGLKPGAEAFALIKASSIILVTNDDGARFSARNHLTGTISRVQAGAVNSEVVIDLSGGGSIVAVVTNDSRQALELEAGKTASAIFKASSVIVGVPA